MYAYIAFLAAAQAASSSSDGLTFAEVIDNLPSDPASVFALLLLLGGFCAILWTGRPRRPGAPGAPGAVP